MPAECIDVSEKLLQTKLPVMLKKTDYDGLSLRRLSRLSSLDLHYPKVNKEKLKELAAAKKAVLADK